jgi:imidazole glycerol-phosphate synthase subunit HisH
MAGQKEIAIVDYGAGNLRSVVNAISRLGHQPLVTGRASDIARARAVILPGVGAAASCMKALQAEGIDNALRNFISDNRPFLGICLGLQVLFAATEENGGQKCLAIFPGKVKKIPESVKTPHMGWNQVKKTAAHPIYAGIPDDANFYFVHSYYAEPEDKTLIAGVTEYGITMSSVIARGNVVATQFHPEKSGELGLKVFANFISFA